MLRARDLIRNKRFDEARALLKTTDHPKAAAWLEKLDTLDPPQRTETVSPMQQTREHGAVSVNQSRMAEPITPYPSETVAPRGSQAVSLASRRRAKARPVQRGNRLRNFLLFFVILLFLGVVGAGAYFVVLPQLALDIPLPGLNIAGNNPSETLAEQFPADTVAYARLRTDDAYIQQLDNLQLFEGLPIDGLPEGMSIAGLLDMAIGDMMPGETFATAIRPWLGDNAAVGLFNADVLFDAVSDNDNQAGIAAVIQIQSKADATAFFDTMMQGAITPTEDSGYTVYTIAPSPEAPIILLNDSRMIITTAAGRAMMMAEGAKLNSTALFNETAAMLPADNYNILIYADTSRIQRGVFNSMRGTLPTEQQSLINAVIDFAGQQAIGFTIQDERSLIIDVVQNAGDTTTLRTEGITLVGASTPVNTALLNRIPGNAGAVFAVSDVRAVYHLMTENAEEITMLQGQDAQMVTQPITELSGMLASAGLNLDEDILSWLNGTTVIYSVYDMPQPDAAALYALNLDAGLMIEATDPAKAQNLVDVLAMQLTETGAPIMREDIGGANAIVLEIPETQLTPPVELVIGANDAVFVIGTRAATTPVLVGDGNFVGSAGYLQAAPYLLSDAKSIAYLDTQGATLIADVMSSSSPQVSYRALAERLASSSISTTGDIDANSMIRLVLTLKP
ncbi:MAG: DUF3352 domain-containing protein [Aggregatilineales bacterium]